jgi:putative aldouronate transport system substrate-binding protein
MNTAFLRRRWLPLNSRKEDPVMKRVLVFCTVIVLALAAATSWAGGTSEKSTVATPKDHMDISIAMWSIGSAIVDKPDAVRDKIYKDLNITVVPMNTTWDDYTQKIQVWAASNQLPDVVAIDALGTQNYAKWIDQGVVKALPSDLSAYPLLKKILTAPGFEMYKYPLGAANGKIYGVPRLNHLNIDDWSTDAGVQVRKDWISNVGAAVPTTMDQFTDLMKAFVQKDPDKNGKNDTIGLTMYSPAWLTWFFLSYEPGIQSGGWVRDTAHPGQWIPAFFTQNTLAGLKALKKLYDAGGMDQDFATLKAEDGRNKFASGKAGAYAHDVIPGTLVTTGVLFEKNFPDLKFSDTVTILKPFKALDGNYYRNIANPAWSESYISSKVSDAKMARILQLFEYYLSDTGYNLTHFGIEGVNYKVTNGKIELIPVLDSAGKPLLLGQQYPFAYTGYLMEWSGTRQWTAPNPYPALQKMSADLNTWLQANAKPVATDLRLNILEIADKDKATINFNDDVVKCILSNDVEKTWKELVANYMANGYDKVIAETNAEAAKAGIK